MRPYNLYRASTYRTTGIDVKVAPDLNIGYVVGAGDEVPQSLRESRHRRSFPFSDDLATGNLSKFDAIILGVRAYAAREDLKNYNARILDYVKNGGVVIVQYNTQEYDHNYGPYPYKMGQIRKKSPTRIPKSDILAPSNPVFTWPNKITDEGFRQLGGRARLEVPAIVGMRSMNR